MKYIAIILLFSFLIIADTTLLASNTDSEKEKVQIELELTQKQPQSDFDRYFGYFKDLLGPIIALIGILMTLPILRKKLIENHITTTLNKIQQANSETQTYNQKLIDKYLPLAFNNDILKKEDIQNAFNDIIKGYHIAQKGSSDVVTLMFYLKTTIQGTIRHYDQSNSKKFTTRDLLYYIIDTLELANFYSTQVVQIPKSSKTEKHHLIKKSLRKYVSFSHITRYKHFRVGVIDDPNSAHYTIFCNITNRTNHPLLMRSAFQIYLSPNAVAKLLFNNDIYAPSILEMPDKDPLFGANKKQLFLIGFSTSTQISSDPEAPDEVVELVYTNPIDFYRFIGSLTHEKIKSDFKDSWIPNSTFDLSKSISLTKTEIETFRLKYDRKYLEDVFKTKKRTIKEKLKESNK